MKEEGEKILMDRLYDWLMSAGNLINQAVNGASGKVANFTSFSDLMNTMAKSGFNGNITDPNEIKAALWFYHHWGNYLQPQVGILSFFWTVLGWLVIALYNVTAALENVFNSLFKLFGLFGYLNDPGTLVGKFYQGFQILGIAIFTLLAVIQLVISVFGKPFKYKDAILHLMLVTGVCAVLPFTITKVSSVLYTDLTNKNYGIENITGKDNKKDSVKDTLAIQPVKNNVTDIMQLVKDDFNTKKYPLDRYGNIKGNGNYNEITDDPSQKDSGNFITHIDFGASLGATDTETLDNLEKNKKMKGIKGLFLHYPSDTGVAIKSVNEHRFVSGANLAEKVYSRYKTNFLAIYAQYIVLIVLLAMMCVKMVTSIFELLVTGLVAPIQGYSSVTSSSKFKELLLTITGTIAGIYFEVIIMRIVLEIMRDFPTIAMTTYDSNGNVIGKSATFFSGMTPFESAIASIVVYLGLFFGAMRGVTIVERWLGVSVGQNDIAQQVMGGMMIANAMGQGAKATGQLVAGVGSSATSLAKQTPDMMKKAGGGLSQATGFVAGVGDQVQKQGLRTVAKSGIMNAHDKVAGGLQDKTQAVADSMKESFDKGEELGNEALKNNYPSGDDYLNKRADFSDETPTNDNSKNENNQDGTEYGSNPEDSETLEGLTGGVSDNIKPQDTPDDNGVDGEPQGGLNPDQSKDEFDDFDDGGGITEAGLDREDDSSGGLQNETPQSLEESGSQSKTQGSKNGGLQTNPSQESKEGEPQAEISQNLRDGGLQTNPPQKSKESGPQSETLQNLKDGGLQTKPLQESEKNDSIRNDMQSETPQESKESGLETNLSENTPNKNGRMTSSGTQAVGEDLSSGLNQNIKNVAEEQPSLNQSQNSSQNQLVTHEEMERKMKPSNLQKAGQNYQQANATLTQGLQQMTSAKSHIKGKRHDEDQ